MAEWVDKDLVIVGIDEFVSELQRILELSPPSEMLERIARWKSRAAKFLRESVSEAEARKFEKISLRYSDLDANSFTAMLDRHRAGLTVLAEEIAAHPSDFFGRDTYVASRPQVRTVFISHSAGDRALAEYLRDEVMRRRAGTAVFIASRPGHIRTGEEWWQTIQRELRAADGFIILLTPGSLNRPWIPFEAGAAWMTGRLLLTVSAGGLAKGSIPIPLGFFQVNSLEVEDEAEAFLVDLGASTEDLQAFCSAIRGYSAVGAQHLATEEGWMGVDVGRRYFAWEGPRLHSLQDWPPIPTPPGLIDAIRAAAFTPSYGTRDKLTKHLAEGRFQVFETDRQTFRRPVLGGGSTGDQILLVRSGSHD